MMKKNQETQLYPNTNHFDTACILPCMLRGEMHHKPKFNMFCALSQKWDHCFEK